jgi:hypothetical protein
MVRLVKSWWTTVFNEKWNLSVTIIFTIQCQFKHNVTIYMHDMLHRSEWCLFFFIITKNVLEVVALAFKD